MSDPSDPDAGGAPPPQDSPQPPGQYPRPSAALLPPAAPNNRRRNWLLAGGSAAVVAVIALIAVLIWAVPSQDESGSTTAENAALDMLAAISRRDVRGIAGGLAPAEARSVGDVLRTAQNKAEQVGTPAGGGASAGLFDGITVTTTGVQTRTEELNDDLARVTFTSGTITLTVDENLVNQGVRDVLGEDLTSGVRTIDVDELRTRAADGTAIDPYVMVVKDHSRWYVSPLYTAVDYRAATGSRTAPDYTAKVDTAKFSDPEEAAAGFVDALTRSVRTKSIGPVAAALPSYYGRVAAIYHSNLDEAVGLDRLEDLTFTGGQYSSDRAKGTTYVTVDQLGFVARSRSGSTARGTVVDNCLKLDGHDETDCLTDVAADLLPGSVADAAAAHGIVATRDGAGWHIDPVQTAVDIVLNSVDTLTDDDLYRLIGLEFDVPAMIMKTTPDATLVGSSSVTLAPDRPTSTHRPQRRVVDVDLTAGRPVTITMSGPGAAGSSFEVFTADGRFDGMGSSGHALTVTPTQTQPARIVVTTRGGTAALTLTRS